MADNTLEAFQIGASLYDRAQTQKRMMDQLQLQTADQVMRQRQSDLQNKIQQNALGDAMKEQQAQIDEFDTFSSVGKQVSDYLDNPRPDAKYPTIPAFKSKQYRIETDRMINNLEKYSARANLLKAQDRAVTASNVLKASTINLAIEAGAIVGFNDDGSPNIDVPKMNAFYTKSGSAKIGQTEARTTSLLGNLEVSKSNLQRLISEGANESVIATAKLEYQKQKDATILALQRDKFGYEQKKGAEEMDVKREELKLKQIRSGQLGEQIAINREKLLKPVNAAQVKLNAFDNTTVNKIAMDVANKDTIAEAIGYEIGILEDDTIQDYVKLNSANSIAKVLNSAEGKDAVGVEEAKRLLGALDVFSVSRKLKGGTLIGPDMNSFIEQLKIKKGELDTRVLAGKTKVNSIYKQYGIKLPAGAMTGSETNAAAPRPKRVRQGKKIYELDEATNDYVEVAQ